MPVGLLEANNPVCLNKWLSLYLIETHRKDGRKFPSSTLDCLLSGLYCHAKKLNPFAVNFMDEKDAALQDCKEFEITLHARGAKKGSAHQLNTQRH